VIDRLLGEGSGKRVYLARDSRNGVQVAYAAIRPRGNEHPSLPAEVEIIRRFGEHPHIVRVLDSGTHGDGAYVVTEYMPGGDVAQLLHATEGGRLPVDRALSIVTDVCLALEHAHGLGVVHRDIKPSNIWLDEDGRARLGDFGLAATADGDTVKPAETIVGTATYMPPEQALGRTQGARSDLYSLGVTLYEMIAGHPPFVGNDAARVISQHVSQIPAALASSTPVTPELDALVQRLLAKQPEARPASAREVRLTIERLGGQPFNQHEIPSHTRPGDLAGRGGEFATLLDALKQVVEGKPHAVVLRGEPGCGKSHLAATLADAARQAGFGVYWGRSADVQPPPRFRPWVEILSAYAAEHAADESWRGDFALASALFPLIPALRDTLGAASAVEPADDPLAIADALLAFLRNATRRSPLLLVIEGADSLDTSSLQLLTFVVQRLESMPLLILTTMHPSGGAAPQVAALARPPFTVIDIGPLSAEDVAEVLTRVTGAEVAADIHAAVLQRTAGNALLVHEIARLLASQPADQAQHLAAASIPQSVKEVAAARIGRLSAGARSVLELAAAHGAAVRADVISAAYGADAAASLAEASAGGLIVAGDDGRFRFSQEVMREAIYTTLPLAARRERHAALADAIERVLPEGPARAGDLARHLNLTGRPGDARRALECARIAAEDAQRRIAPEEGAAFCRLALESYEQVGERDDELHADLLLHLGDVLRFLQLPESRSHILHAAQLAKATHNVDQLVQAALALTGGNTPTQPDEADIALIEDALAALPDTATAARCVLLARLGMALYFSKDRARKDRLTREAVEGARELGDPAVLCEALGARFVALWGPHNIEERLAVATEIIRVAEEAGLAGEARSAYGYRLVTRLELGDIDGVNADDQSYFVLAERERNPNARWHQAVVRAGGRLFFGHFAEGEQQAQRALASVPSAMPGMQNPVPFQFFGIQMFILRWCQGRLGELEGVVKGLAWQFAAFPAWRCALTFLLGELGRDVEAKSEFEALAATDFELPEDAHWLIGMTLLAESAVFLGDIARAEQIYERMLPYEGINVVVQPGIGALGSASLYLGRLAALMGRTHTAERHFEDALEMNRRMRARPWLAYAQCEYGRLLLRRDNHGDTERAQEMLASALDLAQQLGMRALVERILNLRFISLGIAEAEIDRSIYAVATAAIRDRAGLSERFAEGPVTILFSDIENFTATAERLGDEGAQDLLHEHNAIVRRELERHDGMEVKSAGDGFMLAFSDAEAALRCGLAIQYELSRCGGTWGAAGLRVRMGLHCGDVIRESNDFFGVNVILAARIAAQARGGEVLISDDLKKLTDVNDTLAFDEGRDLSLKGLSGTHRVFAATRR
jgi:class 3 adenylate cyclase